MARHYRLSNKTTRASRPCWYLLLRSYSASVRAATTSPLRCADASMASITARPGSESKARADLIRIYAAAVAAVAPARVITDAFEGKLPQASTVPALLAASDRVRLLAVGKAALGMAHEASSRLETKLGETLVIVPSPLAAADVARHPRLRILAGAHPLPDASSEIACRAALDFVAEAQPGELVLFALSGGASALMAAPARRKSLSPTRWRSPPHCCVAPPRYANLTPSASISRRSRAGACCVRLRLEFAC